MGDRALGVCEIVPRGSFYDYTAKYAPGGSDHLVPAPVPEAVYEAALDIALRAHRALGCRGVSRADLRYDDTLRRDGGALSPRSQHPARHDADLAGSRYRPPCRHRLRRSGGVDRGGGAMPPLASDARPRRLGRWRRLLSRRLADRTAGADRHRGRHRRCRAAARRRPVGAAIRRHSHPRRHRAARLADRRHRGRGTRDDRSRNDHRGAGGGSRRADPGGEPDAGPRAARSPALGALGSHRAPAARYDPCPARRAQTVGPVAERRENPTDRPERRDHPGRPASTASPNCRWSSATTPRSMPRRC